MSTERNMYGIEIEGTFSQTSGDMIPAPDEYLDKSLGQVERVTRGAHSLLYCARLLRDNKVPEYVKTCGLHCRINVLGPPTLAMVNRWIELYCLYLIRVGRFQELERCYQEATSVKNRKVRWDTKCSAVSYDSSRNCVELRLMASGPNQLRNFLEAVRAWRIVEGETGKLWKGRRANWNKN